MAVKVRFKASRSGINRMVRAEFMQAEVDRRAGLVVAAAEASDPPVDTGQYAFGSVEPGGFHVQRIKRAGGAAAMAINLAPHAIFVERGSSSNGMPARHIMRNAAYAAGG